MTRDTFITLLGRSCSGADEYGAPLYNTTERRVPAEWDGVKRSEFYQAAAAGFRPEIIFRIYERVYGGERYLLHNDKKLRIIRSYPLSGERIELVCTSDLDGDETEGAV